MNGELVCVTLWEDIPLVAQYLPTPQVATTTAAIAVTAASSALFGKTTGRFTTQSIQTCNQKSDYKDLKD